MKEKIAEGKTKIIWEVGEYEVKIESKDDITAGDGAKRDLIENKAILANNTTCNNFELLKRCGFENDLENDIHYIRRDPEYPEIAFRAHKCEMIPLEVVIRRIATGSYLKRNPKVPEGEVFDNLVVEFFFKDDKNHDPFVVIQDKEWRLYKPKEPISDQSFIRTMNPICSAGEIRYMTARAKRVFLILEEAWRKQNGIILYDLKIEFGRHARWNYKILLADVIDNDSWRIRTKDGQQLDKQVYRDGGNLEEVRNKYEIVSRLTDNFRNIKIEI